MIMVSMSTVTSVDAHVCCCGQPMEGYNNMNFLGFLFLGKGLIQVIVYRGNLVCRVTEHRSAESKVRRDNAAVFMVSDRRKGIHLKKRITNLVI